jgi:hypothetical protein
MNEIENIELIENLPSEGEAELITSISEEKKYSVEIEEMLMEIRSSKDRLRLLAVSWDVPEGIIFELETAEQVMVNAQQSEISQDYYNALKQDHSDLIVRANTIIKNVTPFGYKSLDENSTKEDPRKIESKKIESYFPVTNVNELRRIKGKCANDKDFFIRLLYKILIINQEHFNLQNYEALERLELEKECWDEISNHYEERFSRSSYDGSTKHPDLNEYVSLMISGLYGKEQSKSINHKQRIDCLYSVTKMLLDNYGKNIKLSLRVNVEEKIIDLFVRLAPKPAFALMIRSYGNAAVVWRLDKQDFHVASPKRGRGTYRWASLSLAVEQLKSVFALKKEKNPVLGVTKAERTAPIIRAIVLAEGTKIDKTRNSEELWAEFGKAPVLKIVADTLTYVVEQQHLIDFLTPPDN